MDSTDTWTCPGCGAAVAVSSYCRVACEHPETDRQGQVARALCGCWVVDLPESGLMRLLEAMTAGTGT